MSADTRRFLLALWESTATCLALVLLVALAQPYFSNKSRLIRNLIIGFLFGFITLISMQTPLKIDQGLVIDARVVLVGLSGLVGGWESALVTVLLCLPYRIWMGGPGAFAGSGAILTSGVIGSIYKHQLFPKIGDIRIRDLILFGLVLALNGVAWTFALPPEMAFRAFLKLLIPVTFMYPVSSVLLGSLFLQVIQRQVALEDLKAARLRLLDMNQSLEKTVELRTAELRELNAGLESFAAAVAHDLRSPIRRINSFARIILEENQKSIDAESLAMMHRIVETSKRMGVLVEDLLSFARLEKMQVDKTSIDLSEASRLIVNRLKHSDPLREVDIKIQPNMMTLAAPGLIQVVLENLIKNAWKFTAKANRAQIEVGLNEVEGSRIFFVRDNGAGFNMEFAERLFKPFERLHSSAEFPGNGIGLSTVARIIAKHGGEIWAESTPGFGATFFFTLPAEVSQANLRSPNESYDNAGMHLF